MTNPNPYTGETIQDGFIQLTSEQKNQLRDLYNADNFPEAYRYLYLINVNTEGYEPKVATWFYFAPQINGDDGSFMAEWARNMIINAGQTQGIEITREGFQLRSDDLARDIIITILDGDSSVGWGDNRNPNTLGLKYYVGFYSATQPTGLPLVLRILKDYTHAK